MKEERNIITMDEQGNIFLPSDIGAIAMTEWCRTLAWNGSNWSKPCAPTSATYGRPTKTTCKC